MSDLISRQAAIDALKGMAVPLYKDPACEDIWERDRTLDNAIDAIRGLPSAQPEQQWIPCSERLPDIGEHHVSDPCIVYCSNGVYGFAELEENIFGQAGWNCERDDEYHEPLGEVLAWMPLPEPYAADEEMEK